MSLELNKFLKMCPVFTIAASIHVDSKGTVCGELFKSMVKLCWTPSSNQNSLFFIVSDEGKLNVSHELIPLAKE